MKNRRGTLDRLAVQRPCTAAWETMQGDERKRFCAQCQKTVFDFAQMTPREIRLRLEAGRGDVCARLTHRGGRLAVLEPDPLESLLSSPSTWSERRASPIAATVVTALLGFGSAAAQTAPASDAPTAIQTPERGDGGQERVPQAAGARFQGRVQDEQNVLLPGVLVIAHNSLDGRELSTVTQADGAFEILDLPAGIYDLKAELEGFDLTAVSNVTLQAGESKTVEFTLQVNESITLGGAVFVAPEPLRKVFDDSELVVAAIAGPSIVLSREGDVVEVGTELRVESVVKGHSARRTVTVRHSEYLDEETGEPQALATIPLGSQVIAFLDLVEGKAGLGGEPLYESSDYSFGVKALEKEAREVYLSRLDQLARLERRSGKGPLDADDLIEWLVGTAELPATRDEAIGEIGSALEALEQLAVREGKAVDLAALDLLTIVERFRADGGALESSTRPAVLGAYLSEGHRRRLTSALQSSKRTLFDDLGFFELVRRWDERAANSWLVGAVRDSKASEDGTDRFWSWYSLADLVGDPKTKALAEAASEKWQEVGDLWPDDESEETEKLREAKRVEIGETLRHELTQFLAGTR